MNLNTPADYNRVSEGVRLRAKTS